jgi:hypothetical protein
MLRKAQAILLSSTLRTRTEHSTVAKYTYGCPSNRTWFPCKSILSWTAFKVQKILLSDMPMTLRAGLRWMHICGKTMSNTHLLELVVPQFPLCSCAMSHACMFYFSRVSLPRPGPVSHTGPSHAHSHLCLLYFIRMFV